MPTNTGAKPPPGPARPPPPVVDRENCPPPTGVRGGAGCGVPSEGFSWVPSVELIEELTGEPPVRDPKTSAATLAAEVAALWTVLAALAAVVPRLDGRRNAPPTEAGTVCTGAEGVKPAAGLASAGVGRRLPSPRGAAGEAAGKAAGSATSPRTSPARPDWHLRALAVDHHPPAGRPVRRPVRPRALGRVQRVRRPPVSRARKQPPDRVPEVPDRGRARTRTRHRLQQGPPGWVWDRRRRMRCSISAWVRAPDRNRPPIEK